MWLRFGAKVIQDSLGEFNDDRVMIKLGCEKAELIFYSVVKRGVTLKRVSPKEEERYKLMEAI